MDTSALAGYKELQLLPNLRPPYHQAHPHHNRLLPPIITAPHSALVLTRTPIANTSLSFRFPNCSLESLLPTSLLYDGTTVHYSHLVDLPLNVDRAVRDKSDVKKKVIFLHAVRTRRPRRRGRHFNFSSLLFTFLNLIIQLVSVSIRSFSSSTSIPSSFGTNSELKHVFRHYAFSYQHDRREDVVPVCSFYGLRHDIYEFPANFYVDSALR